MNEIDKLKDLWHDDKEAAIEYYSEIKSDVLTKAKESSKDISARIKKNIYRDIVINILAIPVFALFLYMYDFINFTTTQQMVIIIIALTIVVLYFTLILSLLTKLNKIDKSKDVKESINLKIDMLSVFMKRSKLYIYVSSIFGIFFGIYIKDPSLGFNFPDYSSMRFPEILLVIFILVLLIMIIMAVYYVSKAIYDSFYGQYLKKLKSIAKGFEENENI